MLLGAEARSPTWCSSGDLGAALPEDSPSAVLGAASPPVSSLEAGLALWVGSPMLLSGLLVLKGDC